MKKVLLYVFLVTVGIVIGFGIVEFSKPKSNLDIYDSLVYIESFDEDTIKSGSGFVYKVRNNKTYIVTNYHVIDGYSNIYVYNTEKKNVKASVLNYDRLNDIAILVIDNSLNLKEISIGNSDDIKVGDEIYVAGTPLNIDYISTINKGIISFVNRKITINGEYGRNTFNAIQIDAEVDNGNSGGPLLNNSGKVIGMMIVKEENTNGVSFALPINYVMEKVSKIDNSIN